MKKTSFFILLIFSVFFSYKTAHASTIIDESALDGNSYTLTTNNEVENNIVGWTGGGWGSGTWSAGAGQFAFLRLQYETGSSCPSGSNIQVYNQSFGMYATVGTGTNPSGHICEYPLTFNSGTAVKMINVNLGSASAGIVLDTATSTTGNIFSGNTGASLGTGKSIAFQLCDSGGCTGGFTPFVPPLTSTHIQDILPADGTTTGSTSVVVSANYLFNDPDLPNYLTPPLFLVARLHRTDAIGTSDQTYSFASPTYNALTAVSHTFTLPTNSTWELRWDISGDGYFFIQAFGTPVHIFNVVSDPAVGTAGTTTCDIANLAGCFQNAIVFLFYPSSTSIDQFNGLYSQFINKPPFGYIVGIQNALKNINDSATSAFTLQSLPILNTYIFDPIRIALAWVLWVAFAFVLYHRLKNIAI